MSNFKSRKISGVTKGRPEKKRPVKKKVPLRKQPSYTSRQKGSVSKWIITALIVISGWYAVFFLLPRVEIVIIPETRELVFEDAMILSSTGDVAQNSDVILLPVSRVTLPGQSSQTFEVTGKKDIGDRASGSVTFFNHTGLPYEILVEDGLETLDGVEFTTRNRLTIPGATVSGDGDIVPGTITANIVAFEPGEKANINPQKIFIKGVAREKQRKIYAQNTEAFSGGNSKIVSVVSEEDIISAQELLREQVKQNIINDISSELDYEEGIIGDLFTFVDEDFSTEIKADDVVESFVYTLTARGEVLVYKEEELDNRIKQSLATKLTPNESFISTKPEKISFLDVVQEPSGDIRVFVRAIMQVTQSLDTEQFVSRVLGKREADARRIILSSPSVTNVQFDWSMALSKRIPKSSSHVKIRLKSE